MTGKGAVLAGRVLAELGELSNLVQRAEQGWIRARESRDDLFLDGIALNLHGFYSGLERIFERIASAVDETVPEGANGIRNFSAKWRPRSRASGRLSYLPA